MRRKLIITKQKGEGTDTLLTHTCKYRQCSQTSSESCGNLDCYIQFLAKLLRIRSITWEKRLFTVAPRNLSML